MIIMMGAQDTDLLRDADISGMFTLQDFSALYNRYANAVYANIFKLVKCTDDAEDILQDVFASLWENRHKLHSQSINGWLFVVSHNKAMDHLKRQLNYTSDAVTACEALADPIAESHENEARYLQQWQMIIEAVEVLPQRKKEVFQLCRLEGRSKEEVAAIMGISPKSVADYLKQSHKAIKDYITARHPYAVANAVLIIIFAAC